MTSADPNVDDFLCVEEPEHDWIIPGVIERTDRVILTAEEGTGKSTFLRQLGVQSAASIHPFTLAPMPRIRVMILDLENSARHVRRKLRPLRVSAGDELEPDALRISMRPQGIDLLAPTDVRELDERIEMNSPDLLILGPLYKLANGDPTEERVAKAVSSALDELRVKHDCALLLEAHTPHSSSGGKRPIRPYGASLWMRWPEFGFFLHKEGRIEHWRGQRDERDWPAFLKRGGEWPWTVERNNRAVTFARMLEECRRLGEVPSVRQLAELLNADRNQIQRAADNNRGQWEALKAELGEAT